jgi:hypothetical protein
MSSIQFNRTDRVLANIARTASLNAPDQRNQLQRGVIVVFDITAVPTVETVLLTIEGKDPISGQYYTILAGAAQVAVATLVMRVYPGLVAIANLTVNDILPDTWRPTVTHSAGGSFEYSVAASYVR